MSAAPVPVTYPCGCCPDMGVYCEVGGLLFRAKEVWGVDSELSEILRDEPEAQEKRGELRDLAESGWTRHLAGRF